MSKVRRRSKFPTPCGLPRSAIDDRRNRETLAPRHQCRLGETYLTTLVVNPLLFADAHSVPWLDRMVQIHADRHRDRSRACPASPKRCQM